MSKRTRDNDGTAQPPSTDVNTTQPGGSLPTTTTSSALPRPFKQTRQEGGGNGVPTLSTAIPSSPFDDLDDRDSSESDESSISSSSSSSSSGSTTRKGSRATSRSSARSSSSSLSSPEESSSDSEEEGDGGGLDIQQRLLLHAKLTSQRLRSRDGGERAGGSTGDASSSAGDVAAMLKATSGKRRDTSAAAGRVASPPSARATAMATALQRMKEELTKPVDSNALALTVVNAADESAEVLSNLVATKLPKPPAEEGKKLRRLVYVDHSRVVYRPIRKDFYVAPPDMKHLTAAEMKQLLRELDGAKVRGNNSPRPLRNWNNTGLPDGVLTALAERGYVAPFAVQSLGLPILMSGRDLLVTAKTGSGKTLAYVLPHIRHCVDQQRCGVGEGPIGLVIVPTQELAAQVYEVMNGLCSAAGLRCVASYGSTSLSDNIRHVKAGCDAMVCTPGRLLDLLTVNGGGAMSLQRTSFVVVDEADRLFDSGFMEHVEAFLKNVRPDRQVAMISATMPKELKRVVMQHLKDPIEISVGGKPTPASNVEQRFYFFDEEVYSVDSTARKEEERFLRLLQILGDEGGDGKHLILIFTQRREEVDNLLAKLTAVGYRNRIATLYSGMDAIDREFALEFFVPGKQYILIATAVAERGLDVPFLDLVVNYSLPNHYEAYVHRVGRTGRAGRPGRAVSFFVRGKDDDIAPELVEGLERAEQQVPEELYERASRVRELRKDGSAQHQSGFYRGYRKAKKQRLSDRDQQAQLREAAKAAGLDGFLSSASSASDADSDVEDNGNSEPEIVEVTVDQVGGRGDGPGGVAPASHALALYRGDSSTALTLSVAQEDRIAKALAFAEKTSASVDPARTEEVRFQLEYPINDLPDFVRGKLQSAAFLRELAEETDTTVVRKGVFYDPRYKHTHRLQEGERSLYLLVIGKTTESVQEARKRLTEAKEEALERRKKTGSVVGVEL